MYNGIDEQLIIQEVDMPDYAAMYKRLFKSQTQAIEILQKGQQDTEEMYISARDPVLQLLNENADDTDTHKE